MIVRKIHQQYFGILFIIQFIKYDYGFWLPLWYLSTLFIKHFYNIIKKKKYGNAQNLGGYDLPILYS